MSKSIRVGHSGFISFGSRLLSLFTGLIFITLITRNLSQYDFGLWQLILSIISYSVLPNVIVDYWAIRDLARGERHASTAVLFSLILSAGGMAMYMLISSLSSSHVDKGAQFLSFILAIAQVPLSYLSITLQTISQAARPQSVGLAFITFELIKVVFAIFAFFRLGITVNVAIAAVLFALVAQCLVLYATQPREIYSRSFDRQAVKRWLHLAWLPAFVTFAGYIGTVDTLVVTVITGSTLVLAYYRAANVIAALVSHAGAFTFALYPKLIGGGMLSESRYVMILTMLFSIPMGVGIFILSGPLLSVLGHDYASAYMVLWFAVPIVIIGSVHQIFESVLTAREKVDVTKSSFKDYAKSRLFTVPQITLFGSIISLVALGIAFYWLKSVHADPITMATAWSAIVICVSSPGLAIKWKMMQRSNITFKFPWRNIATYSGATAAMAVVLILVGASAISYTSTFHLVLKLLAYTALGAAIYFPIVFALDRDFRVLTYKSINTAKTIRKRWSNVTDAAST
jgi:O-antigen/teichoic acid export membrane protein